MKPSQLEQWVGDIFVAAGMARESAQTIAQVLVWADLRGMGSHGVMRVPRYVEWMRSGVIHANPGISVEVETSDQTEAYASLPKWEPGKPGL